MGVTGGKGYDYIFDCTGNADSMKNTFRLAANKAEICMVGTPKKELSFTVSEWEQMNRKEFHLTGSWMSYSAPWPGEEWALTAHYFNIAETVIGVFEIQHFFVGTVVRHAVDKHHLDFAVGVFLKCYISKQSVDRLNLVVGDHAK